MNSEFSMDTVPPHTNTELPMRMAAYLTSINNLPWEIQSHSWGIHSLKGREEHTEMYSEHLIKRKLRMERAERQKGRHLKIVTIQNGWK